MRHAAAAAAEHGWYRCLFELRSLIRNTLRHVMIAILTAALAVAVIKTREGADKSP